IEKQNSDQFEIAANNSYELLVQPFAIARGVTIKPGGYAFKDVIATFTGGAQRHISGAVALQVGNFYAGTIRSVSYTRTRINVNRELSLEPTIQINWIDLPEGSFTARLLRTRVDYSFSPRMFVSGLLQYNSSDTSFSSNLRLRWEYRPGSE